MEFPEECSDPPSMQALGRKLAEEMATGGVVALDGELGAGKTEMVKGMAAGMGYGGVVTSPTFTLLHEYRAGRKILYHFDFYRVENAQEIVELGWDELLEEPGSLLAVEWASRFPQLLPSAALRLELEILPEGGRRVTCASGNNRPAAC